MALATDLTLSCEPNMTLSKNYSVSDLIPVSGLACSYGTFFHPAYLWSRLLVCRDVNFYNKITRRGDDSRREVSWDHVNRSKVIGVFCSYVHFSVNVIYFLLCACLVSDFLHVYPHGAKCYSCKRRINSL